MTDAEMEADLASGPDEAGGVVDWDRRAVELPEPKADLHMRIDRDVLDFFRKTGRGLKATVGLISRASDQSSSTSAQPASARPHLPALTPASPRQRRRRTEPNHVTSRRRVRCYGGGGKGTADRHCAALTEPHAYTIRRARDRQGGRMSATRLGAIDLVRLWLAEE